MGIKIYTIYNKQKKNEHKKRNIRSLYTFKDLS